MTKEFIQNIHIIYVFLFIFGAYKAKQISDRSLNTSKQISDAVSFHSLCMIVGIVIPILYNMFAPTNKKMMKIQITLGVIFVIFNFIAVRFYSQQYYGFVLDYVQKGSVIGAVIYFVVFAYQLMPSK